MKKIVTTVLVLVVLLVLAPWGIGKLAEARVNSGLDQVVQEAPYLSIVERKWSRGWFRSEQEVTFEVMGPWIRALNPATVLADIKKAEEAKDHPQGAEGTTDATTPSPEAPSTEVPATDANATEMPVEAPADQKPLEPIRFTIRNEILHGPVLWPLSLGVARVNTRLVLSDAVRKQIMEVFGTDEPVRISTRIGFFGGGTTRFYGEGQTLKFKEAGGGSLSYDDYYLDVGYSSHLDDIDMDGRWPDFEVISPRDGSQFSLKRMKFKMSSERIAGDLYDTDAKLSVDSFRLVDKDKAETVVEDIHYIVDTTRKGDFLDMAARFGSGKIKSPQLEAIKLNIDEVNYDFTFRHLHVKTLEEILTAIKAMYSRPVTTAAELDASLMAPLKQYGTELLKYDPEFAIDRIGITTPEGEGYIKGVVKLVGATAADFKEEAIMGLVAKIDADFNVSVAQKLVEKIPGGATGVGATIDGGYAKREGDKIVSHIEFKQGQLKINGKAQGIPGLGPPPAAG